MESKISWLWISSRWGRRCEISHLSNLASIQHSLTNLWRKNLRRGRIFSKARFFIYTTRLTPGFAIDGEGCKSYRRKIDGEKGEKKKGEKELRVKVFRRVHKFADQPASFYRESMIDGDSDQRNVRKNAVSIFFPQPSSLAADKWSSHLPIGYESETLCIITCATMPPPPRCQGTLLHADLFIMTFQRLPAPKDFTLFRIQFPRNIH